MLKLIISLSVLLINSSVYSLGIGALMADTNPGKSSFADKLMIINESMKITELKLSGIRYTSSLSSFKNETCLTFSNIISDYQLASDKYVKEDLNMSLACLKDGKTKNYITKDVLGPIISHKNGLLIFSLSSSNIYLYANEKLKLIQKPKNLIWQLSNIDRRVYLIIDDIIYLYALDTSDGNIKLIRLNLLNGKYSEMQNIYKGAPIAICKNNTTLYTYYTKGSKIENSQIGASGNTNRKLLELSVADPKGFCEKDRLRVVDYDGRSFEYVNNSLVSVRTPIEKGFSSGIFTSYDKFAYVPDDDKRKILIYDYKKKTSLAIKLTADIFTLIQIQ